MGLSRAFTQVTPTTGVTPTNQYPNSASITDLTNLTASPVVPLPARTANNRRGFLIENDGTTSVLFAYGTTVSVSVRTGLLFPNDFFEDITGYQGPVAFASIGNGGAANITETVLI
jgi:hypothetical protein